MNGTTVVIVPKHVARFWSCFLASEQCPRGAKERFYEVFRVGSDEHDADVGAKLILSGRKTATSSLLWEYETQQKVPPEVGSLWIVEDGSGRPVCIVRTSSIETVCFGEIDDDLAWDYGECDGTVEGWYRAFTPYYSALCESLGKELSGQTPLVWERFEVVFP